MEAKEIYLKIKREITKGLYAYDDQIVAIAKWVESEFEPKKTREKTREKIRKEYNLKETQSLKKDRIYSSCIEFNLYAYTEL